MRKLTIALLMVSLFGLFGCKVSGTITHEGAGLAHVKVDLTGDAEMMTITDEDGDYIFENVSGNVIVTPVLDGYIFNPESKTVSLGSFEDIDGIDFPASLTTTDPADPPETLEEHRLAQVHALMHNTDDEISLEEMQALYTDDVQFVDPMNTVSGIQEVWGYLNNLRMFLDNFYFDIQEIIVGENTIVVRYRHYNTFRISDNLVTNVVPYDSCTIFSFRPGETKCHFQQDYYDQAVVFRELPVMKLVMKFVDKWAQDMASGDPVSPDQIAQVQREMEELWAKYQ